MSAPQVRADRRRTLSLALFLSCLAPAAAPLLAESVDLSSISAPIEVESSSSITLSQSNQGMTTGDLNDDGELDLVIGASGASSGTAAGAVYVLFGPLAAISSPYDLSTDADIDVVGGPANGLLGYAVAVGDVNNDGDADLVVSAPKADGPSSRTDSGAVFVFYGPLSAGTLTISSGDADLTIWGDDAGDQLGHSLTIGNLTDTSALDLGIGAPYADGYLDGKSDAGEVVFLNGPLPTGTWDLDSTDPDETYWGNAAEKHLFRAVVGELTGDSDADLTLSGWGSETPQVKANVYVVFGPISASSNLEISPITTDWVTTGNYLYGSDLLIGDFDQDGQADLVATARIFGSADDYGVVYGYPGPLAGSVDEEAASEADLQVIYPDFDSNKGDATSLAFGDVSNDGIPDLIIGAIGGAGPDNNRAHAGQTNVFYGPVEAKIYDMSTKVSELVVYGAADMWLGWDVAAGDFDNDSKGDLVMLAGVESTGGSSTGKVHILAGGTCYFDAFDDGTLDSGWTLAQLGSANQGSATEAGGVLDLTADGTGIAGTSDDGVTLYRDDVIGDFRVEATIVDLPTNAGGSFKRGGLWVRSSATPPMGYTADQAPWVSVTYLPLGSGITAGELRFKMRVNWGGSGDDNVASSIVQSAMTNTFTLPVRVAIERVGSEFCVYYYKNEGNPRWVQPAGGQGGCTRTTGAGALGHPNINSQPWIGFLTLANHASTTVTYRYDEYAICEP